MTTGDEEVHLIILHHGLWGNVGHVRFIAEQFKQRLGDRLLVYRAQANESAYTYDGIDICGQRLVQEIHSVVKVIESGGNIEDMKGQKLKPDSKSKKQQQQDSSTPNQPDSTNTSNNGDPSSENNITTSVSGSTNADKKKKRVVAQFSFLGYSLGGLIGRFAMAMLNLEGFFSPKDEGGQGVEPVYFVTMATPHLGIRQPSRSKFTKVFNFLSARMLSRTGEQLQLVDNYVDGKPILLVMSEPTSIFIHVLAKFKRRVLYCNIKNDRSVPFWTASFSDADPFRELDAMDIQYHEGYSSLIESYEHHDQEVRERLAKEQADYLKAASFMERAAIRLRAIPWKKYVLFGLLGPILIPVWIVFACSTISVQGLTSRRRTRQIVDENEELDKMKDEAGVVRITELLDDDAESPSSSSGQSTPERRILSTKDTQADSSVTLQEDTTAGGADTTTTITPRSAQTSIVETIDEGNDSALLNKTASNTDTGAGPDSKAKTTTAAAVAEVISYSFPHLKHVRQLRLLPVQIEISRNMNRLKWKKNAIHCATAMNAHASIIVRERRFSGKDGIAAVQHAVDMFKDDGEDA
ncbi:hypothetical protein BGX23_005442 [Mortierella sp. AD031]|nr:hypothetical protein BGX23_005442 [Mortierella sp. AD031]KAG0220252.1 hypothetical protein BGX33_003512 [Mortierella sp. NVP41]